MSGGGKGGKKTEETTIPTWIRDPAARNLQRAEAVQQIPYMPYYGPDVAAFTPTQNAAFEQNIGAAEAFGLLAPNTLTATSGMPTPTDWDGFTGYSSQPIYESALAELKANQPGAVAQYNALFGNAVPAPVYPSSGGGSRFRGSASPSSPPSRQPITTSGFGDVNLGSGTMSAADALHQSNLERGKYTDPNLQALQSTQSGEATARLKHQVSQAQKTRGTMGQGSNYKMKRDRSGKVIGL